MRNILARGWNKIKWPLFLIIWTAGVIGWTLAIPIYQEMRKQADQVWIEHLERQAKNKDGNGARVEDIKSETQSFVPSREEKQPERVADRGSESSPPGEIEKIIYETFGEENYKVARAVAYAESGLCPEKTHKNNNGTTDCGVFQINSIHGLKDCHNPSKNIKYAKQLFDQKGWRPWRAYTNGSYKKFLANI